MSRRTLIVVGLIALVAAILAFVGQSVEDNRSAGSSASGRLLPDLAGNLDGVDRVTVVGPGNVTAVTLRQEGGRWVVAEEDDYPADIAKLREALNALADAEIVEQKTANPDFYSRLSVQPIEDSTATGVEIRIDAGDARTAVVLGDTSGTSQRFARVADAATSYLIDQDPDLPRDPTQWVVPDIVDVPSARVQSVTISHADGETLRIEKTARGESNFAVADVPEGRELQYASVANVTGNALSELKLVAAARAPAEAGPAAPDDSADTADEADADGSRADGIDAAPAPSVVSEFRTFDGLTVTVRGYLYDDERWITVAARFDADQAARFAAEPVEEGVGQASSDPAAADPVAEAEAINARVGGWRYRIAEHQYDQMTRRMSDLLRPVESAQAE